MSDKIKRPRTMTEQKWLEDYDRHALTRNHSDTALHSELLDMTEPPLTRTPGQEIAKWLHRMPDEDCRFLEDLIDAAIAKAADAREAATREAIRREIMLLRHFRPNTENMINCNDALAIIVNAKIKDA